jgi:hypothetical protein
MISVNYRPPPTPAQANSNFSAKGGWFSTTFRPTAPASTGSRALRATRPSVGTTYAMEISSCSGTGSTSCSTRQPIRPPQVLINRRRRRGRRHRRQPPRFQAASAMMLRPQPPCSIRRRLPRFPPPSFPQRPQPLPSPRHPHARLALWTATRPTPHSPCGAPQPRLRCCAAPVSAVGRWGGGSMRRHISRFQQSGKKDRR